MLNLNLKHILISLSLRFVSAIYFNALKIYAINFVKYIFLVNKKFFILQNLHFYCWNLNSICVDFNAILIIFFTLKNHKNFYRLPSIYWAVLQIMQLCFAESIVTVIQSRILILPFAASRLSCNHVTAKSEHNNEEWL